MFGEVVEGMEVVEKMKGVGRGGRGMEEEVGKEEVMIERVRVRE